MVEPVVETAPLANQHSRQSGTTPISIALVGTEGAGKTVLVTCLAKQFQYRNDDGVFLEPLTGATARYVEGIWETLSQQEWPPSTPPGQQTDLRWRLHLGERESYELRLIDVAGQDLRLLFADERDEDAGSSVPRNSSVRLSELASYVRSAQVILFLLNLGDFIGEADAQKRISNQWSIKFALDDMYRHPMPRRCILVLTQMDRYEALVHKPGDWGTVLKKCVPHLYSAYLQGKKLQFVRVAAVSETVVVADISGPPRRVPAARFHCRGFAVLVTWIRNAVRAVSAEQDALRAEAQRLAILEQQQNEERHRSERMDNWKVVAWGGFLALVAFELVSTTCN